ncbi:Putative trehalase [Phaffia rhodozyma]|uniref:carnosine N-methyltransferase n=1 Tax=Phaffia rhodozyma TaxID=264483 RepID=A0A0F7SLH3_PHARH|nr:Putative trehalase [Phaffia rhodozyma]
MSHSHSHDEASSHSHSHDHSDPNHVCGGPREPTPQEIEASKAERKAFDAVLRCFYQYEAYSLSANNRRLKDLLSLSKPHQAILNKLKYREKLSKVDDAIRVNADFLREIADTVGSSMFGDEDEEDEEEDEDEDEDDEDLDAYYDDLDTSSPAPPHQHHSHSHDEPHDHSHGGVSSHHHMHEESAKKEKKEAEKKELLSRKSSESDMDKMRSTIKQFVRDWSVEGRPERDAAYKPIMDVIESQFGHIPKEERADVKILTPGAGLARLAYDIALQGYASQGNEFSFFMLLCSFFILNRTTAPLCHTIHPYIHTFSNQTSTEALLRPIRIPDVNPADLPKGSDFSLIAGDFLEVYGSGDEDQEWDCVATSFFIDTAKNVVEYLETIYRVLKPGGIWINLGPLLWHWENNSSKDVSVELSLDEVKALVAEVGFEIKEESTVPSGYTGNSEGMLKYQYEAACWTAIKK